MKCHLFVLIVLSLMLSALAAQESLFYTREGYESKEMLPAAKREKARPELFNSRSILSTESFEGSFPPDGWTLIDEDGDEHNWYHDSTVSNTGNFSVTSACFISGFHYPDNYLITPAINIPQGETFLSYFIHLSSMFPDYYAVMISTTTPTVNAFTMLLSEQSPGDEWTERLIDLSEYAGATVYLAFRHYNSFGLGKVSIDDVTVFEKLEHDLAALSISGNLAPTAGVPYQYLVSVRNIGTSTATDYTVVLKQDNNVLASATGTSLEAMDRHTFEIDFLEGIPSGFPR